MSTPRPAKWGTPLTSVMQPSAPCVPGACMNVAFGRSVAVMDGNKSAWTMLIPLTCLRPQVNFVLAYPTSMARAGTLVMFVSRFMGLSLKKLHARGVLVGEFLVGRTSAQAMATSWWPAVVRSGSGRANALRRGRSNPAQGGPQWPALGQAGPDRHQRLTSFAQSGLQWPAPGHSGPLSASEHLRDVKVGLQAGQRPDRQRFSVFARVLRAYVISVTSGFPFTHEGCTDIRPNLQELRWFHWDINRSRSVTQTSFEAQTHTDREIFKGLIYKQFLVKKQNRQIHRKRFLTPGYLHGDTWSTRGCSQLVAIGWQGVPLRLPFNHLYDFSYFDIRVMSKRPQGQTANRRSTVSVLRQQSTSYAGSRKSMRRSVLGVAKQVAQRPAAEPAMWFGRGELRTGAALSKPTRPSYLEAASQRSALRSMCGRASVSINSRFDCALTTTCW